MATILDVARRAGVGLGTASRALSGRGSVAADTLARVRAAAAALDFRPSNVARAMTTKSLGMIGVYVPNFAGDFYGPILQTVDAQLRAVDRHMVAANGCGGGDPRQQALDGVHFLRMRECDGALVVSHALDDADIERLCRNWPMLVLLNRVSPRRPAQCFGSDHVAGGRLAARALLSRGHREIACIAGLPSAPDNQDRMAGFHAELKAHGVRVAPMHRLAGEFTFESGQAAAQALLRRRARRFTAVFCANDVMAMAAVTCLQAAGLRVPDDVSVIGYDDSALAAYTMPALTTVRIPIGSAAENGCRYLLNLCYDLALPVHRSFPPELVWRGSVGPGPHQPLVVIESA